MQLLVINMIRNCVHYIHEDHSRIHSNSNQSSFSKLFLYINNISWFIFDNASFSINNNISIFSTRSRNINNNYFNISITRFINIIIFINIDNNNLSFLKNSIFLIFVLFFRIMIKVYINHDISSDLSIRDSFMQTKNFMSEKLSNEIYKMTRFVIHWNDNIDVLKKWINVAENNDWNRHFCIFF